MNTRFQQKFDETFYEAWDRFNDLLRGCPHHGFSELHQLDTFYNALNSNDQDRCIHLNSAAVAIVSKVSTSSSTPAVSSDVAELKDMVRALILDKKNQTPAPAPVKAVEQSCVTCGGGHSYQNCPATDGNIYRDNIQEYVSQAAAVNYNQGNASYRPQMKYLKFLNVAIPLLRRTYDRFIALHSFTPFVEVIFNGRDRCISWKPDDSITPGVDCIYDSEEILFCLGGIVKCNQ
ncbi:hypothetical protein Tco_0267316 [Tanacetum coccineum]